MSSFAGLGTALLIAAVLAVVAAVAFTRRRSTAGDSTASLRVVRVGAIIYGAVVAVMTLAGVIGQLISQRVGVTLPTVEYWPVLPRGVELFPSDATFVAGGFLEAQGTVEGLELSTRSLLAAGTLIQGLTHLTITVAVYLLAQRLLKGEPFQPLISRAIMVSAGALIVGGVLWQVFTDVGQFMAAREVLGSLGWGWDESTADALGFDPTRLMPEPRLAVTIEFWPILTGIALAAVAVAFRHGERLQRDVAGLV